MGQVAKSCGELCALPRRVPLPEPAQDVQLSRELSCALLSRGGILCWGKGQPTHQGRRATGLVMGAPAECYLDERSQLFCGGWNVFGRLGFPESQDDRTASSRRALAPVSVGGGVTSAVVLYHAGCALGAGGLSCWGTSFDCQAPRRVALPERVSSLSGGGRSLCLVTESGAGYVYSGYPESQTPVCEDGPYLFVDELGEPVARDLRAIACFAPERVCTIDRGARVACSGPGGKLDAVPGLPPSRQVAVGAAFACALSDTSRVLCWGDDRFGQLGRGQPAPVASAEPKEPSWPAHE